MSYLRLQATLASALLFAAGATAIAQTEQPKLESAAPMAYPLAAKAAGREGQVTLRGTVGTDGQIRKLRVLNGPEEFRQPAIDAVSRWHYHPYLRNGVPTEVDTTVTVNFTLGSKEHKAEAVAKAQAELAAKSASSAAPDAIFFHGDILTGVGLNPSGPSTPERVTALVIHDGLITYAGDDATALSRKTPQTVLTDLHDAFVVPGFNDAHTHMAFAGQQKLTVDLDNVPSLSAMQQKVADYAKTLPTQTSWITGGGWDHTKWASKTLPTRQDLDAVTGTHPAYLERTDGHIAVVNSAALKAANITAKTVAPQGSQIDVDPTTHEPTGIIREAGALTLLKTVLPNPDAATRRRALELAINDALSHGVTSVQDFSDYEDFQQLQQMEHEGKLPLRFSEWMPFDLPIDQLKQYQASQPADDPFLRTGMLKGFMDGSLGSRTAALAAPYSDDPKNSGLPRYDQGKLDDMAIKRAAAGFRLGFHAIGDRANGMALTAFENANTSLASGQRPSESSVHRFRIEHAQVLLPADFDRFAKLGIIASMQPSHLLTDMSWAADRLGPERSKYAYAWRSFLDHNVTLAFGTDYPVESIDPMRGLYAATTRMNVEGTQAFHPEQKLTLPEALYAYTQASAFAQNDEQHKGRLAPGFFADFTVLDHDITTATPQQILHTHALRTVVAGIRRYDSSTSPTVAATTFHAQPDGD